MTDPTVQVPIGPPRDATGSIMVSLSELDAMVRRAARGVGYTWGMAEEAGRAARWLGSVGVNPSPLFASLFDVVDGKVRAFVPDVSHSPWPSEAGALCPVSAGVAFADRGATFATGSTVQLGETLCPLLLMPFIAWVARSRSFVLQVRSVAGTVICNEGRCSEVDFGLLAGIGQTVVDIFFEGGGDYATATPRGTEVLTDVPDWRRLDQFAKRTCVPATEGSRLSGAGAGTTDND